MRSLMVALACGLVLAPQALAGDDDALQQVAAKLEVPAARAPLLKEAPKAGAMPDFRGWAGPLRFGHLDGRSDRAIPVDTEGYLACDAESIFVALRCFDPAMAAVPNKAVPLDGDVWAADNVEIMLLPGMDPTQPYYQFALNPAGSQFDAKINDKSWNGGATAQAHRDERSWTVLLRVPFAALGLAAGEVPALWRVNLHRARPARGGIKDLDLAWSPTRSRSNHVPSRFGLAFLDGLGKPLDGPAAIAFVEQSGKLQVLLRATFEKDAEGFSAGEVVREDGLAGPERFLRVKGERSVELARNFGAIQGLQMALAYRTAPHQHGLVAHGQGTKVRACRPGMVEVLGRGLKTAEETCRDADGQSRTEDLAYDAFRFKRPYGH